MLSIGPNSAGPVLWMSSVGCVVTMIWGGWAPPAGAGPAGAACCAAGSEVTASGTLATGLQGPLRMSVALSHCPPPCR